MKLTVTCIVILLGLGTFACDSDTKDGAPSSGNEAGMPTDDGEDGEAEEEDLTVVPPEVVAEAVLICGNIYIDESPEGKKRFAALVTLGNGEKLDLTGYELVWMFTNEQKALEVTLLDAEVDFDINQLFEMAAAELAPPFKAEVAIKHPAGLTTTLSWSLKEDAILVNMEDAEELSEEIKRMIEAHSKD